MGSIGTSVATTGDGDLAAARRAVWQLAYDFAASYAYRLPAAQETFEYLDNNDPCAGPDTALDWWFKDLAGCCGRSAGLWLHWVRLAIAVEWNRVVAVAARHGVTVTADRPPRPAADPPFVLLRGYVWSAWDTGLWGDERHLPLADLDAPELAAYEAARTLCACPLCPRLRPDPDVEAAMVTRMSADDAWYLSRTERKSPQVLAAIVRAAPRIDPYGDAVAAVRRYARELPGAWETLMTLAAEPGGGLAFDGLLALVTDRAPADRDTLEALIRERGAEAADDLLWELSQL